MPCEMMVDSRATMALPAARAASTSGENWRKLCISVLFCDVFYMGFGQQPGLDVRIDRLRHAQRERGQRQAAPAGEYEVTFALLQRPADRGGEGVARAGHVD